jgi:hypothetical protein
LKILKPLAQKERAKTYAKKEERLKPSGTYIWDMLNKNIIGYRKDKPRKKEESEKRKKK